MDSIYDAQQKEEAENDSDKDTATLSKTSNEPPIERLSSNTESGTKDAVDRAHIANEAKMAYARKRKQNAVMGHREGDYSKGAAKKKWTYQRTVKPLHIQKLISKSFQSHFLFSDLDKVVINEVISIMSLTIVEPGEEICKEGDNGDKFYVIEEGCVDISAEGKHLRTLQSGGNFGEIALMYSCPRTATVVGGEWSKEEPSKIPIVIENEKLKGTAMEQLMELHEAHHEDKITALQFASYQAQLCKNRTTLWALDSIGFKKCLVFIYQNKAENRRKLLARVKLLSVLTPDELEKLAEVLVSQSYSDGETIMTEGESGDVFYMIESGHVGVWKQGHDKQITTLQPGGCFGEAALQTGEPRTASIIAMGPVKCLVISRKQFEAYFGPHSKLMSRMVKEQRQHEKTKLRALMKVKPSDFIVHRVIGKGGFGVVKLVSQKSKNGRSKGKVYALKIMSKARISKHGDSFCFDAVEEKRLLQRLKHPFIVELFAAMSDANALYFLFELAQGGDLYSQVVRTEMNGRHMIPDTEVQFVGASVLEGLSYMHDLKIAYRDLKPENVVISRDGAVKLIDFQMAKTVAGRTFTTCGTPEYMAPEMVTGQGYTYYVDYWAFGILIYDILIGRTPFQEPHFSNSDTFQAILGLPLKFPHNYPMSSVTDLITKLLEKKPTRRLGCNAGGYNAIKRHKFFRHTDWVKLLESKWPNCGMPSSPFAIVVTDELDATSFGEPEADPPTKPYKKTGASYEKLWDDEF